MKYFSYKRHDYLIANYRPRNNPYERGLHYQLFIASNDKNYTIPTSHKFGTIKEAIKYIKENYLYI